MNAKLPAPRASYRISHKLIGPPFHWLGISCRHFAELTAIAMDRPLTKREAFRRRCHFVACSVCRNFGRQMKVLGPLVRAAFDDRPQVPPDPVFLNRLREELDRISESGPEASPT